MRRVNNHHHAWPTVLSEPLFPNDPAIEAEPYFKNHCEHEDDEFIGATEFFIQHGTKTKQIDVYIHGDDQEVCIRYGDAPHEYITPGTVCDLLTSCGAHGDYIYCAARALIDKVCVIRTTRREQ